MQENNFPDSALLSSSIACAGCPIDWVKQVVKITYIASLVMKKTCNPFSCNIFACYLISRLCSWGYFSTVASVIGCIMRCPGCPIDVLEIPFLFNSQISWKKERL
ncbi:hypothetical protein ABZP36_010656 [Zizania latifolia]